MRFVGRRLRAASRGQGGNAALNTSSRGSAKSSLFVCCCLCRILVRIHLVVCVSSQLDTVTDVLVALCVSCLTRAQCGTGRQRSRSGDSTHAAADTVQDVTPSPCACCTFARLPKSRPRAPHPFVAKGGHNTASAVGRGHLVESCPCGTGCLRLTSTFEFSAFN